jgi:hypothetical protein
MSILKNILCVIVAAPLAFALSSFLGSLYCNSVGGCSAGIAAVNFAPIVGLMLGYFFLVPFLMSSLNTSGKYWWIVIFTMPILGWALYIDTRVMQIFPLVLSMIAGILLGTIAHKTLQKLAPGFMAKIS